MTEDVFVNNSLHFDSGMEKIEKVFNEQMIKDSNNITLIIIKSVS